MNHFMYRTPCRQIRGSNNNIFEKKIHLSQIGAHGKRPLSELCRSRFCLRLNCERWFSNKVWEVHSRGINDSAHSQTISRLRSHWHQRQDPKIIYISRSASSYTWWRIPTVVFYLAIFIPNAPNVLFIRPISKYCKRTASEHRSLCNGSLPRGQFVRM